MHTDTIQVFVADDDKPVRWAIGLLMRSHGWDCREFATAQECLLALRQGTPDCLILDLDMPGMNGAELIKAMRSEANRTPLIVVCGDIDSPLASLAREYGETVLLQKPFNGDELEEAVIRAVAARAQRLAQHPAEGGATDMDCRPEGPLELLRIVNAGARYRRH
jgi:FixJ family two-component response regulator